MSDNKGNINIITSIERKGKEMKKYIEQLQKKEIAKKLESLTPLFDFSSKNTILGKKEIYTYYTKKHLIKIYNQFKNVLNLKEGKKQ
jgi:hypothetical protein